MASIQSLGLGSGVLTTDLVEKLVNAEREVAELRLNNRQELTEAKITAYGEIKSQMSKIQTAAGALSSPSLMGATIVTSSDDSVLTATGSATADPGTYNVEVLNTAKSHALATGSYASFDEIIGTGKLVFTFGELSYDDSNDDSNNIKGQTINPERASKTITIDDSNRTLSGIRDAINKANMGVTATIVNDGNGYRLLMNSSDTGVKNAIRIEAQDAAGNALSGGLGAFAFNEKVGSGLTQTSKGEDAELQVNGLPITRASNTVDEVIKGVTLNLKSADVGKNISINVSPDTEALTESIDSFITAYNDLKSFVDDLSKFDPSSNVGGLLMGDSTIRTMMSQVRALISEPIVGLTGKYRSLTELGVNTDRNNDYLLTFDKTAFSKALNEDRSALIGLLAKTGTTTDSQITYVNDSINTKPGTYDVNITQLATQAKYTAGSLALLDSSSPVIIDDSNNNFSINVNGQTAAVELTKGSYSGEELAAQLALQINSNESLSKFGHSVSVEYNATDKNFSFTSNKYGSESQVYFTSVDANTANTLGFNTLGAGTYKGVGLTTLSAEAFTGKGASTLPGNRAVAADAGINFATSNASFSLDIGAGAGPVAVTVSQNAAGTDLNGDGVFGDRNDTLQAIQNALDNTAGLAGAVTASFDKNGFLTFTTNAIGAAQSIQITGVGTGTSDVLLGLRADQGRVTNGKNPGLTLGSAVEFDVTVDGTTTTSKVSVPADTYATGDDLAAAVQKALNDRLSDAAVSYNYDPDTKLGSFDISIGGNATQVGFTNLDSAAVSFLGLQDASLYSPEIPKGKDVAGTINGVEASGTGQFLRAVDGNAKATNGFYLGNTATDFSTAVDLTASNSTFKISVDGTEAEVTLAVPATYNSGATLAAALQKAINDNPAFKDKNLGVKVEYTDDPTSFANGKFGIISASSGAQSEVRITEANAEVAAVFGFVTGIGDGAKGKAQVGEVDAASGLRLKVTGGNVGSRGSVTYVSGFGDRLKDIMDGFLNGQNSVIAGRERALDTDTKAIAEDRERMEIRLAAQEARLRASFLYNDAIVSKLNTTLDYVKQQFEAMANSKK